MTCAEHPRYCRDRSPSRDHPSQVHEKGCLPKSFLSSAWKTLLSKASNQNMLYREARFGERVNPCLHNVAGWRNETTSQRILIITHCWSCEHSQWPAYWNKQYERSKHDTSDHSRWQALRHWFFFPAMLPSTPGAMEIRLSRLPAELLPLPL